MTIQQFAVIDQVAVASPEPARLPKAWWFSIFKTTSHQFVN
jgi:hypothetical protein